MPATACCYALPQTDIFTRVPFWIFVISPRLSTHGSQGKGNTGIFDLTSMTGSLTSNAVSENFDQ